jgi:uncharacterized protein (DUF362 family)
MDRRDFLRTTAAAGAYLALGQPGRALAAGGAPDLVAVKGGEPGAMFDRGIEALGGMKAFVKKGQKVLVKPNIGWDVPPERGGNTNPQLVARIVEQALAAGAAEVFVFDNSCDQWERCYKTSGIEAAARAAGAKVAPGGQERYFQRVTLPGDVLGSAKVHELLLQADVFINVPVLKHHSSSALTIGMKNHMGVVWDRGAWHRNGLHDCIAEFAAYRKPTLTVVDAYNVMLRNGPRGVSAADVVQMKAQLLSVDPVAADAAAAKLHGTDPKSVRYIALAAQAGVGRMDLEKLDIKRIAL